MEERRKPTFHRADGLTSGLTTSRNVTYYPRQRNVAAACVTGSALARILLLARRQDRQGSLSQHNK